MQPPAKDKEEEDEEEEEEEDEEEGGGMRTRRRRRRRNDPSFLWRISSGWEEMGPEGNRRPWPPSSTWFLVAQGPQPLSEGEEDRMGGGEAP